MSKLTLNTNLPQQTSDGRVRPLSKLLFLMHPQMALCVPSRNFISDFDQYLTSDGSVGPLSKLSFLFYPHRVFFYNISNISYATPGCFFSTTQETCEVHTFAKCKICSTNPTGVPIASENFEGADDAKISLAITTSWGIVDTRACIYLDMHPF